MSANFAKITRALEMLSSNEMLLLREEVINRCELSHSRSRSRLWEAIAFELRACGAETPMRVPVALKQLLSASERAFSTYFKSTQTEPALNYRYLIYRITVREVVRQIRDTARPTTARSICQILADPGGGPAVHIEAAFPGYSTIIPTLLQKRGNP